MVRPDFLILLTCIGAVMSGVGFMAFLGILFHKRVLLYIYIGLIIPLIVANITLGFLAYRWATDTTLEWKTLTEYQGLDDVDLAFVQRELKCCGSLSPQSDVYVDGIHCLGYSGTTFPSSNPLPPEIFDAFVKPGQKPPQDPILQDQSDNFQDQFAYMQIPQPSSTTNSDSGLIPPICLPAFVEFARTYAKMLSGTGFVLGVPTVVMFIVALLALGHLYD
ncbi:hypothetical protein HDU76_009932 [Blyttiomyces sp. JEL0837]|nr:hypothetical protein HDU76_009932 [Blyttiomyces sp. JEL0837]